MKWIKSSRTLVNDLEVQKHPGKRLKIIREAKNRITDFKGQYSLKEFYARLVEAGAIRDDPKDRKIIKRYENGEINLKATSKIVQAIIADLDITYEFAGLSDPNKEAAAEEEPKSKSKKKPASKVSSGNLEVTVENLVEERAHTFFFRYDKKAGSLEIFLYGDRPPPAGMKEGTEDGKVCAALWVPAMIHKYSDSDSVQILPTRETVTL